MHSKLAALMLIPALTAATQARADALAKLQPERLKAVHEALQTLHRDLRRLPRTGPLREYRANLHVHSSLSHDSRGTREEIVAAARAVGTHIVLFTEHPSERHDFFKDGHRGLVRGVLLIPGAETGGFLVYPKQSLAGVPSGPPQAFTDLVRGRGGLAFLCHLEERMDWEVRGLTGTEIYNTHADFKDEKTLLRALRNPLWLVQAADRFRQYPQEAFSALQDYPADYLRRWDQLCAKAPHTGVAANDAHQNVGLVVRLVNGDRLTVEDALGKRLVELPTSTLPALAAAAKDKKPGDVVFQLRLDPYEVSLRHVGTHLLMTELTEKAVWDALEAGRVFVAFDWLADATGFDFAARSPAARFEMGSRLPLEADLRLQAKAPLPVRWRLLRDGKVAAEARGRELNVPVTQPGRYRIEAWLTVAGEEQIWILSNPLYVRPAR